MLLLVPVKAIIGSLFARWRTLNYPKPPPLPSLPISPGSEM